MASGLIAGREREGEFRPKREILVEKVRSFQGA